MRQAGTWILSRFLGAADGEAVAMLARRELSLILRSRAWHRFLGMWWCYCAVLLVLPILYRSDTGRWLSPTNTTWYVFGGYLLQFGGAVFMAQWSARRIRRDLYTDRLDELMMTRCSPADIAMGEGLAACLASTWLAWAALPVTILLAAVGGLSPVAALQLILTLIPACGLGVWFGIGWGLAFALRRGAAMIPLTQWWLLGPFIPVLVGWCALGFFPIIWAVLSFFPNGQESLGSFLRVGQRVLGLLVSHANPLFAVGATTGTWKSLWLTDWLALVFVLVFMTRKSMDAVQVSLAILPERGGARKSGDYWIHHDVAHFTQFNGGKRPEPPYYDGGNPIAAFDVALGHRIYLHPFLWCLATLFYLSMVFWSLLVPDLGRWTAIAAALTPGALALILMSGGVAISFGFERDQHRWPALAVLPISNVRLAMGKVKGVVRPTLWLALLACLTALAMGWRGALELDAALWMGIHLVVFPVALACVSATLALTTPTVGEALYRWMVLGAIPTLASWLPYPIGTTAGIALPCSPPLLVLWLAVSGPSQALHRGAWIAFGLEIVGICASLLILGLFLRNWTVGEKD